MYPHQLFNGGIKLFLKKVWRSLNPIFLGNPGLISIHPSIFLTCFIPSGVTGLPELNLATVYSNCKLRGKFRSGRTSPDAALMSQSVQGSIFFLTCEQWQDSPSAPEGDLLLSFTPLRKKKSSDLEMQSWRRTDQVQRTRSSANSRERKTTL